ncbi:MAG: hypothetical protein PHU44_10260, partial [Syntrophales bacterium]|nr:hypothetical protein [Syntrophales bacterium]
GYAYAINNIGQVAGGAADTVGNQWAFVKKPGQSMQNLGGLGGSWSCAYGLNDAGQVVGEAPDDSGARRAFLWEKGSICDLNYRTVNLPAGTRLMRARAINAAGWIAGSTNKGHAFLLTPLPPPKHVPLELLLLN